MNQKNNGFTLIELLVVVAIIGVISSVVLASFSGARDSSREAATQQSLRQIEQAFLMYEIDRGAYPPNTDIYNYPSDCSNGQWNDVAEHLAENGYTNAPITSDGWGNEFCYDNNHYSGSCQDGNYVTAITSKGANETLDTGDEDLMSQNYQEDDFGIVLDPSCNSTQG